MVGKVDLINNIQLDIALEQNPRPQRKIDWNLGVFTKVPPSLQEQKIVSCLPQYRSCFYHFILGWGNFDGYNMVQPCGSKTDFNPHKFGYGHPKKQWLESDFLISEWTYTLK